MAKYFESQKLKCGVDFFFGLIDIIGNKKYLPAKNAKRAKKEKSKIKLNLFALMIV